jgi:hypothetical protein
MLCQSTWYVDAEASEASEGSMEWTNGRHFRSNLGPGAQYLTLTQGTLYVLPAIKNFSYQKSRCFRTCQPRALCVPNQSTSHVSPRGSKTIYVMLWMCRHAFHPRCLLNLRTVLVRSISHYICHFQTLCRVTFPPCSLLSPVQRIDRLPH